MLFTPSLSQDPQKRGFKTCITRRRSFIYLLDLGLTAVASLQRPKEYLHKLGLNLSEIWIWIQ